MTSSGKSPHPLPFVLAMALAAFSLVRVVIRTGDAFSKSGGVVASSQMDLFVGRYEARFRLLRRRLKGVKEVGYVQRVAGGLHPYAAAFLTQYALAPTVLDLKYRFLKPDEHLEDSISRRNVVGNFHTVADHDAFLKKTKLVVVEDFNNGVVLFRNPEY